MTPEDEIEYKYQSWMESLSSVNNSELNENNIADEYLVSRSEIYELMEILDEKDDLLHRSVHIQGGRKMQVIELITALTQAEARISELEAPDIFNLDEKDQRIAELEQCFKDATDITIAQCDTENKLKERIKELESQLACAVDALEKWESVNNGFYLAQCPKCFLIESSEKFEGATDIDACNMKCPKCFSDGDVFNPRNLQQASKERDERLKAGVKESLTTEKGGTNE